MPCFLASVYNSTAPAILPWSVSAMKGWFIFAAFATICGTVAIASSAL